MINHSIIGTSFSQMKIKNGQIYGIIFCNSFLRFYSGVWLYHANKLQVDRVTKFAVKSAVQWHENLLVNHKLKKMTFLCFAHDLFWSENIWVLAEHEAYIESDSWL